MITKLVLTTLFTLLLINPSWSAPYVLIHDNFHRYPPAKGTMEVWKNKQLLKSLKGYTYKKPRGVWLKQKPLKEDKFTVRYRLEGKDYSLWMQFNFKGKLLRSGYIFRDLM